MKIGITGLPNVGKSSLFNLLTKANAQVAKFPFTTIDRNVGMTLIPDQRLQKIIGITKSAKVTYPAIEIVDIAGLIKGAAQGEGLGNKFLSHIRDVNLVLHVLRCFTDPDIPHIAENINARRDYEIVRAELYLSDLDIVERRIDKIKKKAECREEMVKLEQIKETLAKGQISRETLPDLPLLSVIPEIVVLNLDEDGKFHNGIPGYRLSVKLEEAIQDFSESEKKELRKETEIDPNGLPGLVELCLKTLGIIIFYTIKGEETRGWPIRRGTKVIDAAGMIHSDIKEGFIKAEVLKCDDLWNSGGYNEAQHAGCTKIEGKEYVVQDGDVILIKFR
jgi:ribosome-binding ATPase YchF (GTP1/OBG family)